MKCIYKKPSCKNCRYKIEFIEENNCALESIEKNGPMSLRAIASRLGISHVQVKKIQDNALQKIKDDFS